MRFRDDNGMFSRIRELANNKELREYLETWIKVCFLISNATPDVKFMEEFFKSYSDLTERLRGLQKPVSPEDDAKILEEERNMNSIKESIKEEHKMRVPTDKEIEEAKEYLRQRLDAELSMRTNLQIVMIEAAKQIIDISYRYKISPELFRFQQTDSCRKRWMPLFYPFLK